MSPRTPWAWPSSTNSWAIRPTGVGLRDWMPVPAYQASIWAGPSSEAPSTGVPSGAGAGWPAAEAGTAAASAAASAAALRRPRAVRGSGRTGALYRRRGALSTAPGASPGARASGRDQPVGPLDLELVDEPPLLRHRPQELVGGQILAVPGERLGARAPLHDLEEAEVLLHRVGPVEDRDQALQREVAPARVEDEERGARVAAQLAGAGAARGAAAPQRAVDRGHADPDRLGRAVAPQRHHRRGAVRLEEGPLLGRQVQAHQ